MTFAPELFYSSAGRPRSRHACLEVLDIMVAALGNGDLSEVEDDDDEVDKKPALADMGDTSDNESASSKLGAAFHAAGDENDNDLDCKLQKVCLLSLPTRRTCIRFSKRKNQFKQMNSK